MANPSDLFEGKAVRTEVTGRHGVTQFRRDWAAAEPHASVLILHGIAEHSGRYEHVGSTFAAAGFSARAFDHHGFGRSGGDRGHVDSFDVFLDDVEDNLAELREAGLPVVICAHSMGGLIACGYALSDRPQPDVYLLSGPALGAVVPRWQRIVAPILGRIAPRFFIDGPFDGSLLSTDPDVGTAYEDDPLRVPGATARLGMILFQSMKRCTRDIARLRVPTLVVHGGDDTLVHTYFSEPLGELPLATRLVLDGLRHEVLNEPTWQETMQLFIDYANESIDPK